MIVWQLFLEAKKNSLKIILHISKSWSLIWYVRPKKKSVSSYSHMNGLPVFFFTFYFHVCWSELLILNNNPVCKTCIHICQCGLFTKQIYIYIQTSFVDACLLLYYSIYLNLIVHTICICVRTHIWQMLNLL